ncbi:Os03g0773450 [Oryza sativa Japonica Group]|uniref:Os03g0773450 protein n=1 Tax=Oryza sativa subsp. japonica TaxID=39947 RepID=A0A0P0W3P1_ORYSJ|nr:hypothetical protein EE612_020729 [Oryza sativa]BAS86613.1 Os03g0773450 [Oryza sativa Japonica Group]
MYRASGRLEGFGFRHVFATMETAHTSSRWSSSTTSEGSTMFERPSLSWASIKSSVLANHSSEPVSFEPLTPKFPVISSSSTFPKQYTSYEQLAGGPETIKYKSLTSMISTSWRRNSCFPHFVECIHHSNFQDTLQICHQEAHCLPGYLCEPMVDYTHRAGSTMPQQHQWQSSALLSNPTSAAPPQHPLTSCAMRKSSLPLPCTCRPAIPPHLWPNAPAMEQSSHGNSLQGSPIPPSSYYCSSDQPF